VVLNAQVIFPLKNRQTGNIMAHLTLATTGWLTAMQHLVHAMPAKRSSGPFIFTVGLTTGLSDRNMTILSVHHDTLVQNCQFSYILCVG